MNLKGRLIVFALVVGGICYVILQAGMSAPTQSLQEQVAFNWWLDTKAGWMTMGALAVAAIVALVRFGKLGGAHVPAVPSPTPSAGNSNPTAQPIPIQVSARILRFPHYCACCCEPTQHCRDFVATRVTGKKVIRTTSRSWSFPYCERCAAHAREWPTWNGCLAVVVTMFFGMALWFVLFVNNPKDVGGMVNLWTLLGTLLFGGLVIGGGESHAKKQREKAIAMCGPTCCAPFWAVNYLGWSGSVQELQLYSHRYAVLFAASNRAKLIGVRPELLAAADRVASEERDTSGAPAVEAKPVGPSPAELKAYEQCVAKLEAAKGPGTRQTALEAATRAIRDPDLLDRLLRTASKIEAQAVLDKVDELKTPAAKRRHLEAAIQRLKSDQLDDEIQAEELAMLEQALAALTTGVKGS